MGKISKEELSEMKFINKRFDFGDVSDDTLLIADFSFVNISNNDLIIDYVNPDCTCTGFFLSNDTVCPGDTAFIQLQLNTEGKHGFVKIYLATPAIFKNGSLPEFISKGSYEGIEFELLNMAIGKPIFIGGFDMKKRQPKPMKKAVPAGSVYYLRSNKAQELASKLHSKSISEINPEQGFGICYCGTFNMNEL